MLISLFLFIITTGVYSLPPFDFDNANLENHLSFIEFRNIDGSDNNEANPLWGTPSSAVLRCIDADYGDGYNSLSGETRPNPRNLSNVLSHQRPEDSEQFINNRFMTQFAWQFGQFVDHDITLISEATTCVDPTKEIDITVPCCDRWFDPECVCNADIFIDMTRTNAYEGTGTDINNPRYQINDITSYIDASMVYGADQVRANELRTFSRGLLKTSDSDTGEKLLPLNVNGFPNAPNTDPNYFIAGDLRANEQMGLLAMHTIFMRFHNYLAEEIIAGIEANVCISCTEEELDESTYQYAKLLVNAIIQKITYKDWLPTLFGRNTFREHIGPYIEYNETVDPGICTIFASSAFRFGHSMLPQTLPLRGPQCRRIIGDDLELRDAYFTPDILKNTDGFLEAITNGFACTLCNEVDTRATDAVRNFLFESAVDGDGNPIFDILDLISLNIQRGREHGLPDYNTVRIALGLVPIDGFVDLSSNGHLNTKFASLYQDVNDMDIFLASLAEDHLEGGSFGELISKIVLEQFKRLRDGDRFFYKNYIKDGELKQWIERVTLKGVYEVTTNINKLQIPTSNIFQNEQAVSIFARGSSSSSADNAMGNDEMETEDELVAARGTVVNLVIFVMLGVLVSAAIVGFCWMRRKNKSKEMEITISDVMNVAVKDKSNEKIEGKDNGDNGDGDDKEVNTTTNGKIDECEVVEHPDEDIIDEKK